MPRLSPLLLAAAVLSGAASGAGATAPAAPTVLTATDLRQVEQLETPALSPDGRWVAYVVRSVESEPGSPGRTRASSQIWLAAVDGRVAPRPLTSGRAASDCPAWAPHGDQLAFVRREERGPAQIYLLAVPGGEPSALTSLQTGADHPRWSPDGTTLLFTTRLSSAAIRGLLEAAGRPAVPPWNTARPGRQPNDTANWPAPGESDAARPVSVPSADARPDGPLPAIREWLAQNEAAHDPQRADVLAREDNGPPGTETGIEQLYVIAAHTGAEARAVAPGFREFTEARWLTGGKGLVCVGAREPTDRPDTPHLTSVYTVDLAAGTAQALVAEAGCRYAEPVPSPDGRWIACTVAPGGELGFDQAMVAVVPAGGGPARLLTPTLDRTATQLAWSPDSSAVYFVAADRGRSPLYRVRTDATEAQLLTLEPGWGIRAFAVGSGSLVEIVTHPGNPWELYAGGTDGAKMLPLTTHNSAWLSHRRLATFEPHRLENSEGILVDYWTLKPPDFDPAKKYPLVVDIHGGPAAMGGPGAASSWFELQYLAARGYAVVFSNPRGSSGYGRDFLRANFRDWATGPGHDVLYAADFAAKEPYVDRQRQFVTGDCYGGYLTAWIVGRDRRFKAAVARNGVYELASYFGESGDAPTLLRYWGGYAWQTDIRRLLERDSPATDIQDIRTPLLLSADGNAGAARVAQAESLFRGLRRLGRDVEYVRYPVGTGDQRDGRETDQAIDRLVRIDEFFRRYVGGN